MGWSIGYDNRWKRDIGYGVPAVCDHPDCDEEIDRGLAYVCGSEPHGGENGCGLFFCEKHRHYRELPPTNPQDVGSFCERCAAIIDSGEYVEPFAPKADVAEWTDWKLTDESWAQWRRENLQQEQEGER